MSKFNSARADVHQSVTNAIIKILETADQNGASFPWCRPNIGLGRPTNALTEARYRGINIVTLWATAEGSRPGVGGNR